MKMRKGFTLVELLIVIVIIGILAGAMMLTTGGATDSAQASKIMSDIRNMKGAVAMIMLDSPDAGSEDITINKLAAYMDRPATELKKAGLTGEVDATVITEGTSTLVGRWLIGLTPDSLNSAGVQGKLMEAAKKGGFLAGTGADTLYTSGTSVYMIVR